MTVDGKNKYDVWALVDAGVFDGMTYGGNPITKTHGGNAAVVLKKLKAPTKKKN